MRDIKLPQEIFIACGVIDADSSIMLPIKPMFLGG